MYYIANYVLKEYSCFASLFCFFNWASARKNLQWLVRPAKISRRWASRIHAYIILTPLNPFYIVKLGFTWVYIIILISAQKHRLWVLVRTAEIWKLSEIFIWKFSCFGRKLFSIFTLRKHAYSNILKILQPKTGKFSDKKFTYFSYFCSKHRLWVLVRTASARRF